MIYPLAYSAGGYNNEGSAGPKPGVQILIWVSPVVAGTQIHKPSTAASNGMHQQETESEAEQVEFEPTLYNMC